MQILVYASQHHPASHCRVLQPLTELTRRNHTVAVHDDPRELSPTDAEIADIASAFEVALIARHVEPEAQALARRLRAAGVPVVWDCDEGGDDADEDRRAMLALADVVTTPTESLADRLRAEGASAVVVVPNFLSRVAMEVVPRPHEGVVLGYVGTQEHRLDWERLDMEGVVRDLLEDHPELRIVSVGPLGLGLPEDRCERLGTVPYADLANIVVGFDLGIAPLADVPANRVRSDIKLKEYAIAGVPWLASPAGPYAELGEDEGGRLVDDDEWYAEISRLVIDRRGRRKLAKRGLRWAQRHTLKDHVGVWHTAFTSAIEAAGQQRAA